MTYTWKPKVEYIYIIVIINAIKFMLTVLFI